MKFMPGDRVRCTYVFTFGKVGAVQDISDVLDNFPSLKGWCLVKFDDWGGGWNIEKREQTIFPGPFFYLSDEFFELIPADSPKNSNYLCHCERQVWLLNGCQCGGV